MMNLVMRVTRNTLSPYKAIAMFMCFLRAVFFCVKSNTIVNVAVLGVTCLFGLYCFIFDLKNNKERLIYGIFTLVGLAMYFLTDSIIFLVVAISGIIFKNVSLKNIFRVGFISIIIILCFFYFLSLFGYNAENSYHDPERGWRYSLGFNNTNIPPTLFCFAVLFYYNYKGSIGIKDFLIFTGIETMLFLLTDSRTSLIFYILIILFMLLAKVVKVNKWVCITLFSLIFVFFIMSYIGGIYLYNTPLDKLMSTRLSLIHRVLQHQMHLKNWLFGEYFDFPLDNMYINLIYDQGLIFTLMFLGFIAATAYIVSKHFNRKMMTVFSLLFVGLLCYSFSEIYMRSFLSFIFIIPLAYFNTMFENEFTKAKLLLDYDKRYVSKKKDINDFTSLKGAEHV